MNPLYGEYIVKYIKENGGSYFMKREATVTIRCNEELRKEFKIACIVTDTKATDVIESAMKEFIEKVNNGGSK